MYRKSIFFVCVLFGYFWVVRTLFVLSQKNFNTGDLLHHFCDETVKLDGKRERHSRYVNNEKDIQNNEKRICE